MTEQQVREGNGGARPGELEQKVPTTRGRKRAGIALGLGLLALAALLYWLRARPFEDTAHARVDGNITAVSPRVPGTVTAVHGEDNQQLKEGDLLVELDPADLQVALAQARAAVAQAVAQLKAEQPEVSITQTSNLASVQTAQDEVANAEADLEAAQRDVDQAEANNRFAQLQKARAQQLVVSNTIPPSEYDQRLSAADAAAAAVASARKRLGHRRAQLHHAIAPPPEPPDTP